MLRAQRQTLTRRQSWLWNILLALAYIGTGKLGQLLALQGTSVSAIWPPAGIALVAIFVFGGRIIPGIWGGAFFIGYTGMLATSTNPMSPGTWVAGALQATGAVGAACGASIILRRILDRWPSLRDVSQTVLLLLVGAASCMVSASIGALALSSMAHVPWSSFGEVWLTWWLGDTVGIFVFAPILLAFAAPEPALAKSRQAEAVGLLGLAAVVSSCVFLEFIPMAWLVRREDFVLLPFLTWAALRLGIRHITMLLAMVSIIVVVGTAEGCGPYARPNSADAFLCMTASLCLTVPTILLIAVATQERRLLEFRLNATNQHLEQQVMSRTQKLQDANSQLTQETKRQTEMAAALAHLAAIVQSSDDAIITKSTAGLITSWNSGAEKIYGYAPGEILGQPIKTLMPPDRRDHEDAIFEEVCRGKRTAHFESQRQRKDGTTFQAEITAFAIRNDTGAIIGGAKITRDITERKQREAAARETQERLQLAVRAASIGYWDSDLVSNTVHYSPEWKSQLGYGADELAGDFGIWRELLHPDDRADAVTRVADYIAGQAATYMTEFRLRHKDGAYRWIHSRGNLIKDSAGKPVRLIGCHLDITERKRADANLETFALLGKQLSTANTMREAALLIQQSATRLLDWDCFWLQIADENQQQWKDLAVFDLIDGERREVPTIPSSMLTHSPVIQRVMAEGAQLILRTSATDDRHSLPLLGSGRRSLSLMFAPIRQSDHLIGMISIQSYRLNAYTRADLEMLQALADHCGGALERIRSREIQKKAEQALRDSSERLHLALEVARMGTWDLDLGTDVVHADLRLVKMFGSPEAKILAHKADFMEFVHPQDQARLTSGLHQAIARTSQFHERFRVVWPNHAIHWLEVQGSLFRNLAGQAIRMVGVTVDVTERHEAEEALRRSEQQYAVLVNNIDGIVWEADVRSHRMTFVSHQTNQILGYPASEWIANATFWQDHMHPADRPAALKHCAACTKRGEDYTFEYRMIAADGREVWVQDFVTVVTDQAEPVTLRGVMVDITRRKNLEQEQARAYSLLRTTIESSEDGLLAVDRQGRVRVHNQRFAQMWKLPASLLNSQVDQALQDFVLDQLAEPDIFSDGVQYLYSHPQRESFDVLQFKDGRTFERYSRPQRLGPEIIGRVWSFRDVTERRSNERLMQGQARILEGIASGVPLPETLGELCHIAEAASPGLRCAILFLDEAGKHLRHGVSPSLPDDFSRQVDGLAIGPKACTCGTAVYREATVITEDIATDPLWEDFKAVALPFGLRACWSVPLFDAKRTVFGTVAFYYPTPKRPTARERRIIEMATNTATIAFLEHRTDEQLSRSAKILRQLSANLLEAQEAERRHIARELHDELGQTLTATKITLESLQHDLAAPDATASPPESSQRNHPSLRTAISHVETMLQQVRNLSLSLRPPILDDCGLPAALRWLTDQHTKTTGRPVAFELKHYEGQPEPALQTACFRIAQEALTNVTRHAHARKVNVELHCEPAQLTLVVRDDGVGFDVKTAIARAHAGGSVGLLGQQERAALLGGRVDISSRPGVGSEIRVWFPLTPGKNTA